METSFEFKLLSTENIPEIVVLGQKLNPKVTLETLTEYMLEMFKFETYHCFGLLENNKLIAISSGWITIRFYCGKQLEIDNVIVDESLQSKGIGKQFFEFIEAWAKQNNCNTIELNTYVRNTKSHKFYYNHGYAILGFHFQKYI